MYADSASCLKIQTPVEDLTGRAVIFSQPGDGLSLLRSDQA